MVLIWNALFSDLLAQVSFSSKDYQETHNKRRRDSFEATNPYPTSEFLQNSNPYLNSKPVSVPLSTSNLPDNAASGFSDWDVLLMQLGYVPLDLYPSSTQGLPTDYETSAGLYSGQTYNTNNSTNPSNAAELPHQAHGFSTSEEDVFSLWSDIPVAFRWVSYLLPACTPCKVVLSQDEWDSYLTYLGSSSYSY